MAFATGVASNHSDLYAKLLDFLQNNPTLVAAGQNWSVAWSAPGGAANMTDIVLRGPGLSDQDQVLVGLRRFEDVSTDSYVIYMRGMSGVLPNATSYLEHINVSKAVGMYGDKDPITYWFVANGRRFIVVVKISTVFEAMYGGLFLPYSLPLSYPYPMFIGGSRGDQIVGTPNWRSAVAGHTHFVYPYFASGPIGTNYQETQAFMLDPIGQWIKCANSGDDPGNPKVGMGPDQMFSGFSTARDAAAYLLGYNSMRARLRECFGNGYPLTPVTLAQQTPDDQTYGVLDGVFSVTGYGNSSENIVTVSGVDHLVVQNVFRTAVTSYWALALE
jgi:hypothetical protein